MYIARTVKDAASKSEWDHPRRRQSLVLAFLVALCAGCMPTAGTQTPEWGNRRQDPNPVFRFPGCSTVTGDNLHSRAFSAIVMALKERGWTLDRMDFVNKYVSARVCLANNPENCAAIGFQANLRGDIKATPVNSIERNLEDDMGRWMTILEQSFTAYRCYTDEVLREEMAKYGFSF